MKSELSLPVPTRRGQICRSLLAGILRNEDIISLSKFYMKALKENVHADTEQMRKHIMASFYRHSSTDVHLQHHLYPEGPSSWCFHNRWMALGNGSKVHGDQKPFFQNLSSAAIVQINTIYDDLTSDDILVVCQATPKIRMSLYIQKFGKNVQRINM